MLRIWLLLLLLASQAFAAEGLHPYPLWPSSPVAGWPGVGVDENTTPEKLAPLGGGAATYGQPEFLAYPGAVHHTRVELQRYVPPYPVYDEQTLVRNFVLAAMPPYAQRLTDFAEPVYYTPMYAARVATAQRRPSVKVLPWQRGETISLDLGRLAPSLYVIRPIMAVASVDGAKTKRSMLVQLRVNDRTDDPQAMQAYILRTHVIDNFYALPEFFFNSLGDRELRAELTLLAESDQDVLLHNIDVHDRFGRAAKRKGKTRTVLFDVEARHKLWAENRLKYPKEAEFKLRTPEEQRAYDDQIWNHYFPPMNVMMGQNLGTGQYDRGNWYHDRYQPAPAEWAPLAAPYQAAVDPLNLNRRPPLVFRVEQEVLYTDTRGEIHLEPARYGIQGGEYWRQNARLGAVDEITVKGGDLFKGEEKIGPARYNEIRGGMLLENGKPTVQVNRFYGFPGIRYFDKDGRLAEGPELRLKPGLYYDAQAATGIIGSGPVVGTLDARTGIGAWHQLGNPQAARDQAIRFIRFVYDWPSIRPSHNVNYMMGAFGPDRQFERRYQWNPEFTRLPELYDALFEYIQGNQELASAVGRYLPVIKTPDDVIALLDTRLLQDYANDVMNYRHFYDHGQAKMVVEAALVQDDRTISDPWMEFLWARGWEYPQAIAGLADNLVTSIGRDGATNVGSIFYAIGGQLETIELLEQYIKNGGNPKYDLTDPARYPGARATIDLPFESSPAGRLLLGVGDVGGPSQPYGRLVNLPNLRGIFATGWRWTKSPKFAYELLHTYGRGDETDAAWDAITAAAASTTDPYLMNRSRVLADWGGYLENDDPAARRDFRFKRAAAVRIGNGFGHSHADTLDLRLFAHGLTMSGDLGMRPGYGKPAHQRSRVHNVVEVNGRDWDSHAWVNTLFDAPGASYLRAESAAPYSLAGEVKVYRRQVVMIDVDPGRPSARADKPREDPDVITPATYFVDVFRVSGGNLHTYAFHGNVDDGFEANVRDRKLMTGDNLDTDADEAYLKDFAWRRQFPNAKDEDKEWAADPADDTLVATWRLSRGASTFNGAPESRMIGGLGGKHGGAMTQPRKFTRLHLFNQTGNRILHGIVMDRTLTTEHNQPIPFYSGRQLYAQRRGAEGAALESAFVAIMEPYAGEPFVQAARTLPVADNEDDALRAVAVEVNTTHGHRDLVLADGRPDKVRTVRAQDGVVTFRGEYGYLSRDAAGLRQATLTGSRLVTPEVEMTLPQPLVSVTIERVDYLRRTLEVRGAVPAEAVGQYVEVGNDDHRTTYRVTGVQARPGGCTLTLDKGLEVMRSHVTASNPANGEVTTTIAMLRFRGRDRGLVASNEDATKFWRVDFVGGDRHTGMRFQLRGQPWDAAGKPLDGPLMTPADMPPGAVLRVWETGAGDQVWFRPGVSIQRIGNGPDFQVTANGPYTLKVNGREMKADQRGIVQF